MSEYNGFWTELKELREEYPDSEWGFLENEIQCDGGLTPYDFLHGYCNVFAQMLNEKYGYRIEAAYEEPSQLVHCWCVSEAPDGRKAYIDVRGVTTSFDDLMKDFEDFWTDDEYHYILRYDRMPDSLSKDGQSNALSAARQIEHEYKYYDPCEVMMLSGLFDFTRGRAA